MMRTPSILNLKQYIIQIKTLKLFSKHKIDNYFECSALTQKGINEIFEIAIKTAIQNK